MEKNKLMLIIIIVLLVILLGAIVGGGVYAYNALSSAGEPQTEEIEEIDKSQNVLIEIGDPIYTNLLVGEDQKEHLAKVNLSLDIRGGEDDSEKITASINGRIVVVRDIVNNVLRKKTYEELKKVDGVENFKDEILDKVRKEFNSNLILDVYVNEIVLQ